jgi:hypothetical protein
MVGVCVGGDVGMLVGTVVAEAASVFVGRGKDVCIGAAPWLHATRIAIKITAQSVRLFALLNMLPPLDLGSQK